MFELLLTLVLLLLIFLYHFLNWKPLDAAILYQNHPLLLFGHRGSPQKEPENTIPAFKQAIVDGCNAIELDVYLTKDGHLIVFHDDTLERTTNGSGRVMDQTLAQLQALNAAHLWSGRTEQIPSLQAVVDALPSSIVLNFEIKNYEISSRQAELALIQFIYDNKLNDRVILSSFSPLNIWRVKRIDPSIFTAFIWYKSGLFCIRHFIGIHFAHPDFFHPAYENVTRSIRFWSRMKNIPMHIWVVNDANRMKKLAVDPLIKGIMSDDTELLVNTVGENV